MLLVDVHARVVVGQAAHGVAPRCRGASYAPAPTAPSRDSSWAHEPPGRRRDVPPPPRERRAPREERYAPGLGLASRRRLAPAPPAPAGPEALLGPQRSSMLTTLFTPLLASGTSIAVAILGVGFLIFVHELGHFLACRLTKTRVETFSIGFGPRLFGWEQLPGQPRRFTVGRRRLDPTEHAMDFRVALVPLGGYVEDGRGEPGRGAHRRARRVPQSAHVGARLHHLGRRDHERHRRHGVLLHRLRGPRRAGAADRRLRATGRLGLGGGLEPGDRDRSRSPASPSTRSPRSRWRRSSSAPRARRPSRSSGGRALHRPRHAPLRRGAGGRAPGNRRLRRPDDHAG